jgi:hypothetical protein
MDNETALKTIGIYVLKDIDPKLIELLRKYVESAVLKHRHHRQTELEWNSIYDDVLNYFETVSEWTLWSAPTEVSDQRLSI